MKTLQLDVRPLAAAFHDGVALALAALGAMALLTPGAIPPRDLDTLLLAFLVAIPLQVTVNVLFGIYHGVWRYTSLPDIQRIVFAVMTGTVCVSLAPMAATGRPRVKSPIQSSTSWRGSDAIAPELTTSMAFERNGLPSKFSPTKERWRRESKGR